MNSSGHWKRLIAPKPSILTSRSLNQPNAFGICIVQLIETEESTLNVNGFEMAKGSSTICIRSYISREHEKRRCSPSKNLEVDKMKDAATLAICPIRSRRLGGSLGMNNVSPSAPLIEGVGR